MLVLNTAGEPGYVKSSMSGGGNCVEAARLTEDEVVVRHSRDGARTLRFSVDEWAAFVAGVKNGEFDVEIGA